jgi:hypothetical protein
VFETGTFFQVTDCEFNNSMFAMELIGFDSVEIVTVRYEGVVSPVRP